MSLIARYRLDGDLSNQAGGADLVPSSSGTAYSVDGIGGKCARTA